MKGDCVGGGRSYGHVGIPLPGGIVLKPGEHYWLSWPPLEVLAPAFPDLDDPLWPFQLAPGLYVIVGYTDRYWDSTVIYIR